MIAASALTLMLTVAGFAPPQAQTIVRYAYGESRLDHCAYSRLGEGLIGVAGVMRKRLHRFAHVPPADCVPATAQIAFLAREWPKNYAYCSARFNAGELWRFRSCWGKGHRR